MSSVNTLRGLLVAGAVFAAVVAAFFQLWSVAVLMGVGVAAHGGLSLYLRRTGDSSRPTPPPTGAAQ